MREFRFLVFLIVLLELILFVCALRVVFNRHEAREIFIQIEREQQLYSKLSDERSQLRKEAANLEQTAAVAEKARQNGLFPVDPSNVVILQPSATGTPTKQGGVP